MNQSDCSISRRELPGPVSRLNVTGWAGLVVAGSVCGAELTVVARTSYFLEGGQPHVLSQQDLENMASSCFLREAAGEVGSVVLQET